MALTRKHGKDLVPRDDKRPGPVRQLLPTKGGVTFGPPKSRRSERTIALDADTVQALRGHRDIQRLERDLAGRAYEDWRPSVL